MTNHIIFSLFLIFFSAAILATLALYTRQSLLVAYIIVGVLLGPWGMNFVSDPIVLKDIGDAGIIFLLFLLGLNLQPQNLWKMLKSTTVITLVSSTVFAGVGYLVALMGGFAQLDAIFIGICMMFSSTIIGLKLLPTTVLHHQRIGEVVISVLLLQDIIAIFVLLILHGALQDGQFHASDLLFPVVSLPALFLFAFFFERYILTKLFKRFSRIHEYLFLIAIGWCLGLGQLAHSINLSFEIGAFIAGISIAQSPISRFIAESLRPLRDFFLILFFFSLGAKLEIPILRQVWPLALLLAGLMLMVKPVVFKQLLKKSVSGPAAWEVGVRIGQISEFSLLVAYTAAETAVMGARAFSLVQIATIFSFVVSSYWIVNRYPTPIASTERLRRD